MLRAFLQSLKRVPTPIKSPGSSGRPRRLVCLDVEQLEDRLTPATFSLITPSFTLLAPALPIDTAGHSYSETFRATGGDGHYQFALASGALPTGLSLSSAGVLSGSTTVAGSFTFGVTVTDTTETGLKATDACKLAVVAGAAATFIVSEPSTATAGASFTVAITAEDAYGNTATNFSGSAVLASSDGQPVHVAATPKFSNGTAIVTVTLNTADTLTLTAASGTIKGSGGSITVGAPAFNDWFSQNMPDFGLQDLARADFTRDGSLTYADILGLFAEAEAAGAITTGELQSLQALVTTKGAAAANLASSVQSLTHKVVDGDPANALYQGTSLGNLKAGSAATQLQKLVDKWFLGEDLPRIDTQYIQSWGPGSYALASGTLFGSGGPTYKDVVQGEEGDCWLLSSFGVTAANDPAIIASMFTDDGNELENGVQVHVWTVRFFDNGVASYVTVNNYFPAVYGMFAFANLGQAMTNPNNVLWVPLAEKAYAQLGASGWDQRPAVNAYASLNGGTSTTALPAITGGVENNAGVGGQNAIIAAISSGTLLTLGSAPSGNKALGIVGDHDYGVLGYNAATQTFTLLNPWGWDNTSGDPGILNLTWAQIKANFTLDGDCNPPGA